MSIRDLMQRKTRGPVRVSPAQAHVKACLAAGRAIMRDPAADYIPEGWKILGTGYFSSVYGVDDSTVVKCGPSLDGGYVYAMWALANQHLDGVPRIYAVQRVTYFEGDYDYKAGKYYRSTSQAEGYVVVMERLQEMPKDNWGSLKDGTARAQYDAMQAAVYRDSYEADHTACPASIAIMKLRHEINAAIKANGENRPTQYFDLHMGNVMVRGETVVITDPIATVKGKTKGKFARKRYSSIREHC